MDCTGFHGPGLASALGIPREAMLAAIIKTIEAFEDRVEETEIVSYRWHSSILGGDEVLEEFVAETKEEMRQQMSEMFGYPAGSFKDVPIDSD